jgi:hypothetical protein
VRGHHRIINRCLQGSVDAHQHLKKRGRREADL